MKKHENLFLVKTLFAFLLSSLFCFNYLQAEAPNRALVGTFSPLKTARTDIRAMYESSSAEENKVHIQGENNCGKSFKGIYFKKEFRVTTGWVCRKKIEGSLREEIEYTFLFGQGSPSDYYCKAEAFNEDDGEVMNFSISKSSAKELFDGVNLPTTPYHHVRWTKLGFARNIYAEKDFISKSIMRCYRKDLTQEEPEHRITSCQKPYAPNYYCEEQILDTQPWD